MVDARGGIAGIERAFQTSIREYKSRGRKLRAPATPVSIPARLGGSVLAVVGLDETWYSPNTESVAPPAPASRDAGPARITGARKSRCTSPRPTDPSGHG